LYNRQLHILHILSSVPSIREALVEDPSYCRRHRRPYLHFCKHYGHCPRRFLEKERNAEVFIFTGRAHGFLCRASYVQPESATSRSIQTRSYAEAARTLIEHRNDKTLKNSSVIVVTEVRYSTPAYQQENALLMLIGCLVNSDHTNFRICPSLLAKWRSK
jgi:hypothetical protein